VTTLTTGQRETFLADALTRLATVAGVQAVLFGRIVPVGFGGSRETVDIPGHVAGPDEDMELNHNAVAGDYFAAMGIPIVAGRALSSRDLGQPVVVINETMAHRYWPDGQALGRTLRAGGSDPLQIVGVARDAKYRMLREDPRPSYYLPLDTRTLRTGVFHVRVAGSPNARLTDLRHALQQAGPTIPVTDVRTLRSQADANINDDRVAMTSGVTLAASALVLAAVGLFGAMCHVVAQRTRELGIRIAWGADRARLTRLVLRQGLGVALLGGSLGLLLSTWTTRAIESRLFHVLTFDPMTFTGGAAALTAVALLATALPAARASRVDPIVALREE
jgi:predicted permease